MKRILLAGYYGFGNAGDELLLEAMIHRYRGHDLQVLSNSPRQTQAQFKVQTVDRWSFWQVFGALRACDVLVFGGGGIFQDRSSFYSNFYYYALIVAARFLNKTFVLNSLGIGPLQSRLHRYLLARVLRGIKEISLRDQASLELLRSCGVQGNLQLSCDPVLTMPMPLVSVQKEGDCFGIILRSCGQWKSLQEPFLEMARSCLQNQNMRLHVFVLQSQTEQALAEQFVARLNSKRVSLRVLNRAQDLFQEVAELDLLLSLRFHGLIVAARQGVACFSVAIDPKIENFLADVSRSFKKDLPNFSNVVQLKDISSKKLTDCQRSCWQNRDQYSKELLKAVTQIQVENQ